MIFLWGIGRRTTFMVMESIYLQVDKRSKDNFKIIKLSMASFYIQMAVFIRDLFSIMNNKDGVK